MIYLDHAATTPMLPQVRDAMMKWMDPRMVGNPSSIHTQGRQARNAIEEARANVAKMIGAKPSEIYFTSGGTESNNAWMSDPMSVFHIITDDLEHDSILEPSDHITMWRTFVKSKSDGAIDLDHLSSLLEQADCPDMYAVSAMWVNNEIGTINPIQEIGALCKKHGVMFHTDAIQAAGHVPIDVKKCLVDALSMSAHKFGGPMGVGTLYLSDELEMRPWIYGGGQERGMRGGTENVPGIIGMGVAAKVVMENLEGWMSNWSDCRSVFVSELYTSVNAHICINGSDVAAPNIISLTIPGVNSETLLLLLDQRGIYISAGSACSAGSPDPSHVLKGIGLSDEDAACTVRISMGVDTTVWEMREAANNITKCANYILGMTSES